MREIAIQAGGTPQWIRTLVCGLPSSGKTTFAATAPKPLFISDESEGGYKSLYSIDPAMFWDPKVPPKVWSIESMRDMPAAIAKLETMKSQGQFPFSTVVIDPLSIYVDRVLAELQAASPGMDNRKHYGDLANILRTLVQRVHALPCHVIWLSHIRAGMDNNASPAIGGQMGEKFPAYCDFKWLTHVQTAGPNQPPVFELRTAPFRSFTFLGGRFKVPDPLIPSFKCVAQVLGLPDKPVSPSVPGYPEGVQYQV